MRRGLTLVEILVAAAIGTVVFSAAMMIYHIANKGRGVTAAARALQTALLIEEYVRTDVARLAGGTATLRCDPAKPSRVAFQTADLAIDKGPSKIALRAVQYFLEAPRTLLKREYDAKVEAIGASPLEEVEFVPMISSTGPLMRVNLTVGRTADDPNGPPTLHSFLVRLPQSRMPPTLEFEPVSAFLKPDELPADAKLPEPDAEP